MPGVTIGHAVDRRGLSGSGYGDVVAVLVKENKMVLG